MARWEESPNAELNLDLPSPPPNNQHYIPGLTEMWEHFEEC